MLAPAKINLALHVTGQRPDKYHLLNTLVVFAGFGDEVYVTVAERDGFACFGPRISPDLSNADNLCLRARDALRTAFPDLTRAPVQIDLDKRLPVASGVGGGSSDAAATLKLLAAHWSLTVKDSDLAAIAAPLGADLPMCLKTSPLIARGIGDEIQPLQTFPELHLVLANPGIAVTTPDVFRRLTVKINPPLPPLPSRMDAASVIDWLKSTRNDLQAAAIAVAPLIADCLAALENSGAQFVRMSGSGATCFGIFHDQNAAALAAQDILLQHPDWFVVATRCGGTGD